MFSEECLEKYDFKNDDSRVLKEAYIYALKGLAIVGAHSADSGLVDLGVNRVFIKSIDDLLNNLDEKVLMNNIYEIIEIRDELIRKVGYVSKKVYNQGDSLFKKVVKVFYPSKEEKSPYLHDAPSWYPTNEEDIYKTGVKIINELEKNPLKNKLQLITYGALGVYEMLDRSDYNKKYRRNLIEFMMKVLASTLNEELTAEQLDDIVRKIDRKYSNNS
ncbi:hypothetical protein [Oceanirhabdus sp. W0125-5]|uniref:hypothetical protein n=1 Tax=Oceanirhabdus sp. W0125-5 TaxID=2999116 RepID=UPI0022F2EF82|nr:hypothetical protein [Oceanirhabdus sp. W0125-5]WBW96586.1 hypothetical protein OW730_23275 [Oceanirhabdus sp. W0125-5]